MDRRLDDVTASEGSSTIEAAGRGLSSIFHFGPNPGNLRMTLHAPPGLPPGRPVVVVLHGCTQSVEGYDRAAGWSTRADSDQFTLVMPSQRVENNHQTCFNWFEPGDITRGQGEVASIRAMVDHALALHRGDPARVFICGLSAGGAMTAALLATYPDVFAGGAIIAGLPFGTANNVNEALESMRPGRINEAKTWGDLVRGASRHAGPWPTVAVWHGTEDPVVKPINAGELVKQWTNVHGVGAHVPAETQIGPATRRVWSDRSGRACVTEYILPGLGHGAPVAASSPPAPFFVPAPIDSTDRIADDWGLGAPKAPRRRVIDYLGDLLR